MMYSRRFFLASALLIFLCDFAFADDAIPACGVPQKFRYLNHNVPRIRTGESYDRQWSVLAGPIKPGEEDLLKYKPASGFEIGGIDLEIKPSIVFILQGTPNPNLPPGSGELGSSYTFYLDFAKKLGDWGMIFCQLMSGWGDTVQGDLNVFSSVNYDSYDIGGRIKLRRYYYEQYAADKQITLRVGMMKTNDWFDQNSMADDSDIQFLNDSFNTLPTVEWPSSWATTFAEEVVMNFNGADYLQLNLGHFEGNADYQQLFAHGLYIAEAKIMPAKLFNLDPAKWAGNYRLYGWVNNRNHFKYSAKGEPHDRGGYINYGWGLSCDQMLGPAVDIFGRLGWQRPDVIRAVNGANVEWAWSAGIQICGSYWNRMNDHIAFAVGQDFVGKPYIDAGNPGANEGHVEIYYTWRVNECLAISPDVQLIWNPNGVSSSSRGDDEAIFAYGLRAHYAL